MKVLETTDYSKFKFLPQNRSISRASVDRFKEILPICNLLPINPILCDKDFNVIDGQHRLTACKELGIPVHYYIKNDAKHSDIRDLNSAGAHWTRKDFVHYYATLNQEPYPTILKVQEKYGIPLQLAISLVNDSKKNIRRKHFEAGKLKMVNSMEKIEEIMDNVITMRDWLRENLPQVERLFIKHLRFLMGLIFCYNHEDIDKEKLTQKLKQYCARIHTCGSVSEYIKMLVNIYNINNRAPVVLETRRQQGLLRDE